MNDRERRPPVQGAPQTRRDVIAVAGAVPLLAWGAAAPPAATPGAAVPPEPAAAVPAAARAGYRETAHVRRFYALARY